MKEYFEAFFAPCIASIELYRHIALDFCYQICSGGLSDARRTRYKRRLERGAHGAFSFPSPCNQQHLPFLKPLPQLLNLGVVPNKLGKVFGHVFKGPHERANAKCMLKLTPNKHLGRLFELGLTFALEALFWRTLQHGHPRSLRHARNVLALFGSIYKTAPH